MYICMYIYVYVYATSSLSIHPSMGIWALSILWLVDSAAINIGVHVSLQTAHLYPLDKCLVVQFLGHRVFLFLMF